MENFETISDAVSLLGQHLEIITRRRDSRIYDLERELNEQTREYLELIINLDNQEIQKHNNIIKGLAKCL